MKRFILLTRQRSGSTVIAQSLDQHPDIFCSTELFLNQDINHQEWQFPFLNLVPSKPYINNILNVPWGLLKANAHLKNYFSYAESEGFEASGFKLMLGQAKLFPIAYNWFLKEDTKKMVLIRENPLQIAISELKAKKDGYSHLKKEESVSNTKVKIEPARLIKRLKSIKKIMIY